MTEISVEEYRALMKLPANRPSKYGAIRCEYRGHKFDSKAERDFFPVLELLLANRFIDLILRQVPVHLPWAVEVVLLLPGADRAERRILGRVGVRREVAGKVLPARRARVFEEAPGQSIQHGPLESHHRFVVHVITGPERVAPAAPLVALPLLERPLA